MPTNMQRLVAAIASIGITVGGAWLASKAQSNVPSDPQVDFPKGVPVSFRNVRNAYGNVEVLEFADREAFKTYDVTKAVGYPEVPAKPDAVTAVFPNLKKDPYAIATFHDEDEIQDLTMDGAWPWEGYATSGALDAYDTPRSDKLLLAAVV